MIRRCDFLCIAIPAFASDLSTPQQETMSQEQVERVQHDQGQAVVPRQTPNDLICGTCGHSAHDSY